MAPEALDESAKHDQKADIWSFGITALELARGKPPYSDYTTMKVSYFNALLFFWGRIDLHLYFFTKIIYVYMYVCIYVYMYICIYLYMYIYLSVVKRKKFFKGYYDDSRARTANSV
jgi:serine/threonine protein kinase